jgi:dTDP-4-amino-4,6-dideoxygalactose transaminase
MGDIPFALYDIDPETLGPDLDSLRITLKAGARSVVIAHLFGMPVDVESVEQICREEGALLIEDSAQGTEATIAGRPAGTFGSVSILSFGRGKGLSTGGGGAVLAHDAGGRDTLRAGHVLLGDNRGVRGAREMARLVAQWALGRPTVYWLVASLPFLKLGVTVYRERFRPGSASRVWPHVLPHVLALAEAEAATRRRNAARLLATARTTRLGQVTPSPNSEPSYLRLPLRVPGGLTGRAEVSHARKLGVMGGYPRALVDLAGFGTRAVNRDADLPGAREVARTLCTLPTHSCLAESDIVALETWMKTVPDALDRARKPELSSVPAGR